MNPLVLGLLFGLYFGGGAEVRRFEREAAKEILSKLQGPEAHVEVTSKVGPEIIFGDVYSVTIRASNFSTQGLPLFTEPERSRRGILRNLRLELSDFTLNKLHVDRLVAEIPDCRFDLSLAHRKRQIRLSQSGVGTGWVEISESNLEDFIRRKFAEIKQVSVKIEKDKVFVEGYGEFIVFNSNFTVIARLEPIEGTKLNLAFARILFDGKVPDPASSRILLDVLNPIVDLNKDLLLHDAVKVEKLVLRDGILRAEGATQIPVKPKDAMGASGR